MNKTLLYTLLAAALFIPAASAQRIEKRKDLQDERIDKGRESGQLTKKEAVRLRARQKNLNQQVREDRRDGGGMTAAERAKIEKRQDNLSKDIYKQKHDAQTAPPKP